MLGTFNLLPLLKGWQYKAHELTRVVQRGAAPNPSNELKLSETGWLKSISIVADDCQGALQINWQDPSLNSTEIVVCAELLKAYGYLNRDYAGYVVKYFRPNPYSTAGLYVIELSLEADSWPFIPTVIVRPLLRSESTQLSANIYAKAWVINITDRKLFIQSLRSVLQARPDLEIDAALFVDAPGIFGEKWKK